MCGPTTTFIMKTTMFLNMNMQLSVNSNSMPNGDGSGNMHSSLGNTHGASGSHTRARRQLGPAQYSELGLPSGEVGAGTVALSAEMKGRGCVKQTNPSRSASPVPLPVQSGYQLPGPSGRLAGGAGGGGEQVWALQAPSVQLLPPQGSPSAEQHALLQVPPAQQLAAAQLVPASSCSSADPVRDAAAATSCGGSSSSSSGASRARSSVAILYAADCAPIGRFLQ